MTPKWQRARFIKGKADDAVSVTGLFVWVEIGQPCPSTGRGLNGARAGMPRALRTNIKGPQFPRYGTCLNADAECIELLARDDKDFAEDMELVPWEEWLKIPLPADKENDDGPG